METCFTPGEWFVTLHDGNVAYIRADGYSKADGKYHFAILMVGTPNFEFEVAAIPMDIVASIRGGGGRA